jgi:hypothetical protein
MSALWNGVSRRSRFRHGRHRCRGELFGMWQATSEQRKHSFFKYFLIDSPRLSRLQLLKSYEDAAIAGNKS